MKWQTCQEVEGDSVLRHTSLGKTCDEHGWSEGGVGKGDGASRGGLRLLFGGRTTFWVIADLCEV